MKQENDDLRRIIGDLTIANDALKKPWRQADVTAARIMHKHEPAQGSRVLGYIKAPMILQVVGSGIGFGRGV